MRVRSIIFGVILMTVLLSGCALIEGNAAGETTVLENGEDAGDAGDAEKSGYITIGFSQVGAESDWRVANTESIKSTFTEEKGYELLYSDAQQKQEKQITAIRRFIQQGVDYILLAPVAESGWDTVLQEAKEAGIPVIIIDRKVSVSDDSLYTAFVGSDFSKEGSLAVTWMENHLSAKKEIQIVHIQGTADSSAQLGRSQALEQAVEDHDNWQICAQLDGGFTMAESYECMQDLLINTKDIDVIYCENDNMAFGAIQALQDAGIRIKDSGIKIISFDATRQGLIECLNGNISMTVECDPLQGEIAETIIQQLEKGETPEKYNIMPTRCFEWGDLTTQFIESRPY